MDEFLEKIGETGEASEFSINPERASTLLTEAWAARGPRFVYPLHLLASAVASGATKFEFSRRPTLGVYLKNLLFRDRWDFVMEHDGEPPTAEELQKLQDMLSVSCRPPTRSLALACQVAQTLYKARVCVEAGRGDTLDRLVVKNGVWNFFGGLRAARKFKGVRFRVEYCQGSFLGDTPFDSNQEFRTIQRSGLFAPTEMANRGQVERFERKHAAYWESDRANAVHTDLTPRPSPYEFSLQIAIGAHFGGWTFVRHGIILDTNVVAAVRSVQLVVSSGSFRTDISGTSLVADKYLESVMNRCYELLGSLLGELDLHQISHREIIKNLLSENHLHETLPQLYRWPVFETLDGTILDATEALAKGQESPECFSRAELTAVVSTWARDCLRYEFGQGFLPISRMWGDGPFLLCQADNAISQGILDCELREFKQFGFDGHVVIPGTTSLFTCSNIFVQTRDMSGKPEDAWETVEHGGDLMDPVFEDPVLSATPELGLVLSQGTLHKWSFRLREFVKKVELGGDFTHLEYWYEGVVLIEGESEWGLLDTRKDAWLIREPRVEVDIERSFHLRNDGSMAVEEFPRLGEGGGEARLRFYRLEGGRLKPLNTSWQEWAGRDVECRGQRLGEAPGKVFFRHNGCLWSAEAGKEPKLLVRNDGIRALLFRDNYVAWTTEAGCHVFCRRSGKLAFYEDTSEMNNCLLKRDPSDRLRFGGKLLNPLTGEEATNVSFAQSYSCPDHLSLWSDGGGNLVLCDPSTGRALVECPNQSGEYWLNERWIARYTKQWTIRAAEGGKWSPVALPALTEQINGFLWNDLLVLEDTGRGTISLYRLPAGIIYQTVQGKLLGLSPCGENLAYLKGSTIILHNLSQDVIHQFDKDEDKGMSADFFLGEVHASARFLDSDRFAHPWIGVLKKEQAGWNLLKPGWMETPAVQVNGDLMGLPIHGQVVIFDFQSLSTVATLHADGREWFFYTPLGLYDCSEKGETLLRSDIDKDAIQKFRREGLMKTVFGKT